MNIPSSLLFQNERISSIYTFSPQGFYVAFGIFVFTFFVIFLLFHLRKKSKISLEKPILPPVPDLLDAEFEVKMANYLRYLIYQVASPKHTYAHTSREIRHYMNDRILIDALSAIEKAEYNNETLSQERRNEIILLAQKYVIKK